MLEIQILRKAQSIQRTLDKSEIEQNPAIWEAEDKRLVGKKNGRYMAGQELTLRWSPL